MILQSQMETAELIIISLFVCLFVDGQLEDLTISTALFVSLFVCLLLFFLFLFLHICKPAHLKCSLYFYFIHFLFDLGLNSDLKQLKRR